MPYSIGRLFLGLILLAASPASATFDAEFVSVDVSPRVVTTSNPTFTVSVTVKNTGVSDWQYIAPGGSPTCDQLVKLAVIDQAPDPSIAWAACDSGGSPAWTPWIDSPWSSWVQFMPSGTTVAADSSGMGNGGEFTFTFSATAGPFGPQAAQPGRFQLVFQMFRGGQFRGTQPFGPASIAEIVFIDDSAALPASRDAEFVSATLPGLMEAGKRYPIRVKFRNTGSIEGNACDDVATQNEGDRVGIDFPPGDPRKTWSPWREFLDGGATCSGSSETVPAYSGPPNTSITPREWIFHFDRELTAPSEPGVYPLVFRLFEGGLGSPTGVKYFGEPSPTRLVKVVPPATVPKLPNIINIVADDLDYCDLRNFVEDGVTPVPDNDHAIETDTIDQLISQGMSWTHYRANGSICSPTRTAIMTGRNPVGLGIKRDIAGRGVPPELPMLSEWLKQRGYTTGHFGKWHIGYSREDFRPTSRGFDESLALLQGSTDYWCYELLANDRDSIKQTYSSGAWNLPTSELRYIDKRISDAAVAFINSHRDEPFFLNIWFYAPHAPHFGGSSPNLTSPSGCDSGTSSYSIYEEQVEYLDELVGEVLTAVSSGRNDLTRDTIILFSSDNGGQPVGSTRSPCPGDGLRGAKGDSYDRGLRVPLVIRWPDGPVPPNTKNDSWAFSQDFFPTLAEIVSAELAAIDLPFDNDVPFPSDPLDIFGTSLRAGWLEPSATIVQDGPFYWEQKERKSFFELTAGTEAEDLVIRDNYAVLERDASTGVGHKLVREIPGLVDGSASTLDLRLFDIESFPREWDAQRIIGSPIEGTLDDQFKAWRLETSRIPFTVAALEGDATYDPVTHDITLPLDGNGDATAQVVLDRSSRFDIHRGDFTFSARVTLAEDPNPPGATVNPIIAELPDSWSLRVDRTSRNVLLDVHGESNASIQLTSATPLTVDQAADIAFTIYGYNAGSPITIATLYVDGQGIENRCLTSPVGFSDESLILGNDPGASMPPPAFVGTIEDLQMHHLALYKDQLAAAGSSSPYSSNTVVTCP